MVSRFAMSLAMVGAWVLMSSAELQAQACAKCHDVLPRCDPAPGQLLACISWDEWFGTGCNTLEVAFCGGQITNDSRISGSPTVALILNGSEAARTFWNQLGCGDAATGNSALTLSYKREEEAMPSTGEAELERF